MVSTQANAERSQNEMTSGRAKGRSRLFFTAVASV
jgi:hypothetical protein